MSGDEEGIAVRVTHSEAPPPKLAYAVPMGPKRQRYFG
jgi:hypothetical protein